VQTCRYMMSILGTGLAKHFEFTHSTFKIPVIFGHLMTKTCLIIVFNHRYDKNIPILEKVYGDRFAAIYFLVPFYDGDHPNVIPVYESSNYFQSFFAQGFQRFYREEYTHYMFLGDDCIMNPVIRESNLLDAMGLPEGTDYISELQEFHRGKGLAWWHTFKGIDFFTNRKGAEIERELPSRDEALRRFQHHGLAIQPLSMENIFGSKKPQTISLSKYWGLKLFHYYYKWKKYKKNGKVHLPYPVVGAYSDFLVITNTTIREFSRYCGIMAAAGLFVEIAIPTALVLSSKKIAQEKDIRLTGKPLWTPGEVAHLETIYNKSLSALINNFPQQVLFYHPVKLSKWTNDL
jgi:hypothetical protein